MGIHRIRLQGPWDVIPPDGTEADTREARLPACWNELFGQQPGTAVFLRKFNQPTNLTADDQVLVRVPVTQNHIIECELNGTLAISVGDSTQTFDVTSLLQLHNRLRLTVTYLGTNVATAGLREAITLQIISPPEESECDCSP